MNRSNQQMSPEIVLRNVDRRRFSEGLLAMLAGLATGALASTPYPMGPIKLIVPFPPGGAFDLFVRALAEKLTVSLGQSVIVESKPGANGMIAVSSVADAPADGKTFLMMSGQIAQNAILMPGSTAKLEQLVPMTMLTSIPFAFIVNASTGVNTFAEFIEYAKKRKGQLAYGSFGQGSSSHILGEAINRAAGMDLTHVAYKGDSALFPDLASGRVAAGWGTIGFFGKQSKGVRLLFVVSPTRLHDYPSVPTLSELGYPQLNLAGWAAMFAPKGTPAPLTTQMTSAVRGILSTDEMKKKIESLAYSPLTKLDEPVSQRLDQEIKRWGELIRQEGITVS